MADKDYWQTQPVKWLCRVSVYLLLSMFAARFPGSLASGVGVLDFYLLPFFREKPFPAKRGRLRPRLLIDTDNAIYETGSATKTLDLAARYSHTVGNLDYGLHFFLGRGRTPYLIPSASLPEILRSSDETEDEVLVPF